MDAVCCIHGFIPDSGCFDCEHDKLEKLFTEVSGRNVTLKTENVRLEWENKILRDTINILKMKLLPKKILFAEARMPQPEIDEVDMDEGK